MDGGCRLARPAEPAGVIYPNVHPLPFFIWRKIKWVQKNNNVLPV